MAGTKTIQTGTATIATGSTSGTAAITAVDTSKSFLIFSMRGDPGDENTGGRLGVSGYFSGSTQLTFQRQQSGGDTNLTIRWYVISFDTGVTVQHGTTTDVRNNTADVTITSVNTARSFVVHSTHGVETWDLGAVQFTTAQIVSSTALRLRSEGTEANTNTVRWQVVDYDGAAVQTVSGTIPDGSTSGNISISAVTMVDTFIVGNMTHLTSAYDDAQYVSIWTLSSTTQIAWERQTGYQDRYYVLQAVSISGEVSVQRGSDTLSAGTSENSIIAAVDTAQSFTQINGLNRYCARSTSGTLRFYSGAYTFEIYLSNPTTVTTQREVGSADAKLYWETVEFASAVDNEIIETPIDRGVSRGLERAVA